MVPRDFLRLVLHQPVSAREFFATSAGKKNRDCVWETTVPTTGVGTHEVAAETVTALV